MRLTAKAEKFLAGMAQHLRAGSVVTTTNEGPAGDKAIMNAVRYSLILSERLGSRVAVTVIDGGAAFRFQVDGE